MQSFSRKIEIFRCVAILALAVAGAAGAGAAPLPPEFASADLQSAVAATGRGQKVRLTGVEREGAKTSSAFDLERFEIFTDDATVTIHSPGGKERVLPRPRNSYFRGTVEGEPDSRVFLAVLEDGSVQGIVKRGARLHFIGSEDSPERADEGPLRMRDVTPLALATMGNPQFACGNAELPPQPRSLDQMLAEQLSDGSGLNVEPAVTGMLALPARTARVAIETDFEFYQLFNNATTATNYIGNLLGYDSAIAYIPELSTSLQVSSISLWSTSGDPWAQSSTFCGLLEFGKYWNTNRTGVSRTIAHFLSGKPLGGGVAWLGVLCSGAFSTGGASSCPGLGSESTPWGGGYGFTAGISGAFNVNNPTVMWDSVAVAHEIGHNFDSPHSHCYNGVGGNANPIDACYANEGGCWGGASSLPGTNTLNGSGDGTIMSYCHLLGGGYSNIAMTFGSAPGFASGVAPGREASLMNNYLASVVSGNGSCLAGTGPAISAISPSTGPITGGQAVTISGSGFVSGATVTIGGSSATAVLVLSSSTVTAVTPSHAAGTVSVVVANPSNGRAVLPSSYVFGGTASAPTVTSASPAGGPLAGKTAVTIKGTGFVSGATATFSGAAAVPTTFVDSTTLRATTPANGAGIKSLTVTNPGGLAGILANGFFYADESGATNFFTVTPCRALDTRTTGGALAANATRTVTLAGVCGIPAGAKAVALNVTVTGGTTTGMVGLFPGNAFPLGTSALNYRAGVTKANNAMAELATNGAGTLGVQNAASGTVHLLLDVSGYWQ